jgi:hypothetical protein
MIQRFVFLLFSMLATCALLAQELAPTEKYIPKSATASLEHMVAIGGGFHLQQLSLRSANQQSGGTGGLIHEIRNYYLPHFEATYSHWFHERNYIGLTFRTGTVGYAVDLKNTDGWAIFHPSNTEPIATFEFREHHLYYFGTFWQYDLTREMLLVKGSKNDLLLQFAMLTELGFNYLNQVWDQSEIRTVPSGAGIEQPWVAYDTEYIRASQIRYGLRLRTLLTFNRYSLVFDAGYNLGLADFHFTDIQALPGPTPTIEIRNQLNYLFLNLALGYWF